MSGLYFMPPRGAFVDANTGELTRAAVLFLRGLYERVGGATGEGTHELAAAAFEDAGIEEIRAGLYALGDEQRAAPVPPAVMPEDDLLAPAAGAPATEPDTSPEIAALRSELEALRQIVQGLLQATTA